jgi:hypothetical protein
MEARMRRSVLVAFLAGSLPVIAVLAAYLLNIFAGDELEARFICNPYWDGCVSISRAARSGPGLYLFRLVMIPVAVLLLVCWNDVRNWLLGMDACSIRRSRIIFALGALGAVFLVSYVTALGSEGEWYRWMRRYGVTVYFGGTALAQLLLAWVLWPQRRDLARGALPGPVSMLMALVCLQWALGLASVIKRVFVYNPEMMDRIENIIEWAFALPMSLAFVVIAVFFLRSRRTI